MRVLKFGGTSLATPRRIRTVTEIIRERNNEPLVIVFSALGGITNLLVRAINLAILGILDRDQLVSAIRGRHGYFLETLAKPEFSHEAKTVIDFQLEEARKLLVDITATASVTEKERARILASGERLSVALLTAILRSNGLSVSPVDATTIIRGDSNFGNSSVDLDTTTKLVNSQLRPQLDHSIAAVTGFIAGTDRGVTATLGRNGSDYSATILGHALNAEAVEIWTDVDGVLSADPRSFDNVQLIPELSFNEANELAVFGAKVIHPKTIRPAAMKSIPIRIKNTFRRKNPGTWIRKPQEISPGKVKGITGREDISVIELTSRQGPIRESTTNIVLSTFKQLGIVCYLHSPGKDDQTARFIIHDDHPKELRAHLESALSGKYDVGIDRSCGIVAVIGDDLSSNQQFQQHLKAVAAEYRIDLPASLLDNEDHNILILTPVPVTVPIIKSLHAFLASNWKQEAQNRQLLSTTFKQEN